MIRLGHFLPGGVRLGHDSGLNETYRGIIESGSERITAYVKFCPGKELINELFTSVLARKAGLRVPRAFLVKVAASDYPHSPAIQRVGTDALAFATEAVIGETVLRRINFRSRPACVMFLSTWDEWIDVASFDDWTANTDRNLGNLLVGARGDVWLIDHGRAFTGATWTAATLNSAIVTTNKLCHWASGHLTFAEKLAAYQRSIQAGKNFGSVDCAQAIDQSLVSKFLSTAEKISLLSFVQGRSGQVHDRISDALGLPGLKLGSAMP